MDVRTGGGYKEYSGGGTLAMLVDHCFKMAAKMKTFSNVGRKICNPVISTDVMGNRNVEVRPVGAWVQTEDPNPQNRHEAVVSSLK